MRALFLLLGVLTIAGGPLGAADRLALRVSPHVCFAPANLAVRATVEADKENRALEIIAESEDFYRSSEIPLDGDRAPLTTLLLYKNLPSGGYEVRVVLKGSGGRQIASVSTSVNVLDSGAR